MQQHAARVPFSHTSLEKYLFATGSERLGAALAVHLSSFFATYTLLAAFASLYFARFRSTTVNGVARQIRHKKIGGT